MPSKDIFIGQLLPQLLDIAAQAGALIMTFYRGGHAVDTKPDASPVTEADRAADRLIVKRLKPLAPQWPVVSEEGDKPSVTDSDYYWLVDPLDGTKSFVRGSGYFTVNIGLIDNATRQPVAGIIYEPVQRAMYWGSPQGAFRRDATEAIPQPLHVRRLSPPCTAIVSHSRLDEVTQAYLDARGITKCVPCASSFKFCRLAEGKADVYPRFGPTSEWDTAAGHAILLAAGGAMTAPDGTPFLYGKPDFINGSFVAYGDAAYSHGVPINSASR